MNTQDVLITMLNKTYSIADITYAPMNLRVSRIGPISAVVSWLPANSNLQHVIAVNDHEVQTVRKGLYRYLVTGKYVGRLTSW